MPGDSEFIPPVQYLPWWGIIGFFLLLAIIGWYVFLFASTRASRARVSAAPERESWTPRTTETVRTEYLDLIDQVRLAYASGTVDSRETHHQLSQIVRSYVSEREGRQTMQMTLKDLRATNFTPLTDAVERLYPGAFGAGSSASVDKAVDQAKKLVSSWR